MKHIIQTLCMVITALLISGCVIGVESIDDAPVSEKFSANNEAGTAERVAEPIIKEHEEINKQEYKTWDGAGRPFPKDGWSPFWAY